MIKVGQIYKKKNIKSRNKNHTTIYVITSPKVRGKVYTINNFGRGALRFAEDFDCKDLIAEYPTWQEAVNSPEFNEVENEQQRLDTNLS